MNGDIYRVRTSIGTVVTDRYSAVTRLPGCAGEEAG